MEKREINKMLQVLNSTVENLWRSLWHFKTKRRGRTINKRNRKSVFLEWSSNSRISYKKNKWKEKLDFEIWIIKK